MKLASFDIITENVTNSLAIKKSVYVQIKIIKIMKVLDIGMYLIYKTQ